MIKLKNFTLISLTTTLFIFTYSISYLNAQSKTHTNQQVIQEIVEESLKTFKDKVDAVHEHTTFCILRANEAIGLAHSANGTSIKAYEIATESFDISKRASEFANKIIAELGQIKNLSSDTIQQTQMAIKKLNQEYEQLSSKLKDEVKKESTLKLENKIKIAQAKIHEKQQSGIYEKVKLALEKEKWKNIKEILSDPSPIIKTALSIIIVTLCIYLIKYGTPKFLNYLTKPNVISETSKHEWFECLLNTKKKIDIENLIFTPSLQSQLSNLLLRVRTSKDTNESLPNVLFYGGPGTGKTAFVKALAYTSGLDYALTSGSEFAKIKDLNDANNELRKLLNWAKKSKNGLIVFIDEAESLFANRKLPTTSKITQDFINTFLSLVPDQSQKKLMFIFATNHPFKLDDAIANRIGINIEFALPGICEREKILLLYLSKYAQENKNDLVDLNTEIKKMIPKCAFDLEGFSPRAIKFIAEDMIIKARHSSSKKLTNEIMQATIENAKYNLQQALNWENERNKWKESLISLKELQ